MLLLRLHILEQLVGVYAFRHKTKHGKFIFGFPLIALLQLGLCVYLAAG